MDVYKYKIIKECEGRAKKSKDVVLKAFSHELNQIKSLDIKNFTFEMLRMCPGYFYSAPSSATGKHHPYYEKDKGGLVVHTRSVVYMLQELLILEDFNFTEREQDLLIAAAILHDSRKNGENPHSEYTKFNHPELAREYILQYKDCGVIPANEIEFITEVIRSHMGQWNVNGKKSKFPPLEKPKTKAQKVLHYADYIVSREGIDLSKQVNAKEYLTSKSHYETTDIEKPSSKAVLNFGKYKGEILETVFKKDVEYLNWCYSKNAELKANGENGFITPNLNIAIREILFGSC